MTSPVGAVVVDVNDDDNEKRSSEDSAVADRGQIELVDADADVEVVVLLFDQFS